MATFNGVLFMEDVFVTEEIKMKTMIYLLVFQKPIKYFFQKKLH
jgi:hypothetical protein